MIPDFIDIDLVIEVTLIVVKLFIIANVLFLAPLVLTWVERKVAGHIQVRLGPFRVGFHGILQAIADAIKILMKEDMTPTKADKWLFKAAPVLALAPIVAVFVVIPFGEDIMIGDRRITLYVSDMNVAILYVLALSGLAVYGVIFAGWASNSKYALLGGLRAAAQMISYEVAMSFAVVGVVMINNTLSLVEIVSAQSGGALAFMNWNVFFNFYGFPLGLIWFVIFLISGMAEMNRIPFDLIEDEGTLAAGINVEYSAMRFAFLSLAEYVVMISISVLSVTLFFGGWHAPFGLPGPPVVWFLIKTTAFIYFFMWTRFTFPRYRYDQLMTIGWKVLIPLCLVMVLLTGLVRIP